MKFYTVVFIDNQTQQETVIKVFQEKKSAKNFMRENSYFCNGKYIVPFGQYVILEMGR